MPSSAPIFNSIVRTAVPIIAGLLLTGLLRLGVEIDDTLAVQVATALVTFCYYVGGRLLEEYVAPKLGWLLGVARAPRYAETTGTTVVDQPPPGRDAGQSSVALICIVIVAVLVAWLIIRALQ